MTTALDFLDKDYPKRMMPTQIDCEISIKTVENCSVLSVMNSSATVCRFVHSNQYFDMTE